MINLIDLLDDSNENFNFLTLSNISDDISMTYNSYYYNETRKQYITGNLKEELQKSNMFRIFRTINGADFDLKQITEFYKEKISFIKDIKWDTLSDDEILEIKKKINITLNTEYNKTDITSKYNRLLEYTKIPFPLSYIKAIMGFIPSGYFRYNGLKDLNNIKTITPFMFFDIDWKPWYGLDKDDSRKEQKIILELCKKGITINDIKTILLKSPFWNNDQTDYNPDLLMIWKSINDGLSLIALWDVRQCIKDMDIKNPLQIDYIDDYREKVYLSKMQQYNNIIISGLKKFHNIEIPNDTNFFDDGCMELPRKKYLSYDKDISFNEIFYSEKIDTFGDRDFTWTKTFIPDDVKAFLTYDNAPILFNNDDKWIFNINNIDPNAEITITNRKTKVKYKSSLSLELDNLRKMILNPEYNKVKTITLKTDDEKAKSVKAYLYKKKMEYGNNDIDNNVRISMASYLLRHGITYDLSLTLLNEIGLIDSVNKTGFLYWGKDAGVRLTEWAYILDPKQNPEYDKYFNTANKKVYFEPSEIKEIKENPSLEKTFLLEKTAHMNETELRWDYLSDITLNFDMPKSDIKDTNISNDDEWDEYEIIDDTNDDDSNDSISDEKYPHRKILINAGTGLGKTNYFTKCLLEKHNDLIDLSVSKKYLIIFLLPTKSLAKQTFDDMNEKPYVYMNNGIKEIIPVTCLISDDQISDDTWGWIIGTYDNLPKITDNYKLKSLLNNSILIIDEIHEFVKAAPYRKNIIYDIQNTEKWVKCFIGLSGTMIKNDYFSFWKDFLVINVKRTEIDKKTVKIINFNETNELKWGWLTWINNNLDKSKVNVIYYNHKKNSEQIALYLNELKEGWKVNLFNSDTKESNDEIIETGFITDCNLLFVTTAFEMGLNIKNDTLGKVMIVMDNDKPISPEGIKQYENRFRKITDTDIIIFGIWKDLSELEPLEWIDLSSVITMDRDSYRLPEPAFNKYWYDETDKEYIKTNTSALIYLDELNAVFRNIDLDSLKKDIKNKIIGYKSKDSITWDKETASFIPTECFVNNIIWDRQNKAMLTNLNIYKKELGKWDYIVLDETSNIDKKDINKNKKIHDKWNKKYKKDWYIAFTEILQYLDNLYNNNITEFETELLKRIDGLKKISYKNRTIKERIELPLFIFINNIYFNWKWIEYTEIISCLRFNITDTFNGWIFPEFLISFMVWIKHEKLKKDILDDKHALYHIYNIPNELKEYQTKDQIISNWNDWVIKRDRKDDIVTDIKDFNNFDNCFYIKKHRKDVNLKDPRIIELKETNGKLKELYERIINDIKTNELNPIVWKGITYENDDLKGMGRQNIISDINSELDKNGNLINTLLKSKVTYYWIEYPDMKNEYGAIKLIENNKTNYDIKRIDDILSNWKNSDVYDAETIERIDKDFN